MEHARTLEAVVAADESPLAHARLHRQLTVDEAARRANVSPEEVQWLEEGRLYRFPTPDRAVAVALLYTTDLGIEHREALELAGLPARRRGRVHPARTAARRSRAAAARRHRPASLRRRRRPRARPGQLGAEAVPGTASRSQARDTLGAWHRFSCSVKRGPWPRPSRRARHTQACLHECGPAPQRSPGRESEAARGTTQFSGIRRAASFAFSSVGICSVTA